MKALLSHPGLPAGMIITGTVLTLQVAEVLTGVVGISFWCGWIVHTFWTAFYGNTK